MEKRAEEGEEFFVTKLMKRPVYTEALPARCFAVSRPRTKR